MHVFSNPFYRRLRQELSQRIPEMVAERKVSKPANLGQLSLIAALSISVSPPRLTRQGWNKSRSVGARDNLLGFQFTETKFLKSFAPSVAQDPAAPRSATELPSPGNLANSTTLVSNQVAAVS